MERRITAAAVVGDYAGYNCPVSGKWVEGRRAHEENLKRNGCRVYEAGETEQFRQTRAQEEAKLDAEVDKTVEQFYEALPSDSRFALGQAIESGLDVSVERS